MPIAMIIIFLVVAIAGRVALQYRLTGDHGIRLANKSSSGIALLSGALILIYFIGIIVVTISAALGVIEPYIRVELSGTILGALLCLGGTALTSFSQVQMGKEWRIGVDNNEKTALVTRGIYSKVRNPIYTGVFLFGLGQLLLLPHIAMLSLAALGYLAIELQVRKVEEPYLYRLHGEVFEDYRRSTGRYMPKFKGS